MKLRNKKTGEIVKVNNLNAFVHTDEETKIYNSLADLNAEWEDVPEEPKGYYYVATTGLIKYDDTPFCAIHKDRKLIGNYFETKEEAELAVRKLKAWKRLKDKGFINEQVFSMNLNWCNPDDYDWKAFKLLFGGEE